MRWGRGAATEPRRILQRWRLQGMHTENAGEVSARHGQRGFRAARRRMLGAEDPTSPLDHVLHDGLDFEQVVA